MKQSKIQLLKNVALSATSPRRLATMVEMVIREQGLDTRGSLTVDENLSWLNANLTDFESEASRTFPELWSESEKFAQQLKDKGKKIILKAEKELGYPLGGGGYYPFLYFLTRKVRPRCVVETGVAAGFSSQAFLSALDVNGSGGLFSSDFPYFRVRDAENYIGIVVDDDLRPRWNLFLEGDKVNLPRITDECGRIDLFHYDSDKSYSGRSWALSFIEKFLSEDAFIVMDDIQDNSFFHDYVSELPAEEWSVFEFENKFVGVVGNMPLHSNQNHGPS